MPGPYRISGAIFPREIPNGPAFGGTIEIEGVKYNISLWEKTSKAGNSYLQISEDKRAGNLQGSSAGTSSVANKFKRPAVTPAPSPINDLDDDVPFAPEFR